MDTINTNQLENLLRNLIYRKIQSAHALDKHQRDLKFYVKHLKDLAISRRELFHERLICGLNSPNLDDRIFDWKMAKRHMVRNKGKKEEYVRVLQEEVRRLKKQEKRIAEELWYRAYLVRAREYLAGQQ
jgi:hypothetical protein